jgi:hypothetical protein
MKKDTLVLENLGWTVLPVFNENGFVRNDGFYLPFFTGVPTKEILNEMEFTPAYTILNRETAKGKKGSCQYIPNQSLLIRIYDPQLSDCVVPESKCETSSFFQFLDYYKN